MTSDRTDELIALAALGELTSAQLLELDAAVLADPTVATALDEALAAAAAVQVASAEEPPLRLRGDVLAAIRRTPQQDRDDDELPPVPSRTPDNEPSHAPPAVVSLDDRRRRRFLALVVGAAAALVLVVGGVVVVSQQGGGSDDELAVVEASDAVTLVLDGDLDGSLQVTYSPSQEAIVVEGEGVPELTDAETYQLWLVGDGEPVSAGLFRPDDDGSVLERLDDVDPTGMTIAVTEEPAGGSRTPTLPVLAST